MVAETPPPASTRQTLSMAAEEDWDKTALRDNKERRKNELRTHSAPPSECRTPQEANPSLGKCTSAIQDFKANIPQRVTVRFRNSRGFFMLPRFQNRNAPVSPSRLEIGIYGVDTFTAKNRARQRLNLPENRQSPTSPHKRPVIRSFRPVGRNPDQVQAAQILDTNSASLLEQPQFRARQIHRLKFLSDDPACSRAANNMPAHVRLPFASQGPAARLPSRQTLHAKVLRITRIVVPHPSAITCLREFQAHGFERFLDMQLARPSVVVHAVGQSQFAGFPAESIPARCVNLPHPQESSRPPTAARQLSSSVPSRIPALILSSVTRA